MPTDITSQAAYTHSQHSLRGEGFYQFARRKPRMDEHRPRLGKRVALLSLLKKGHCARYGDAPRRSGDEIKVGQSARSPIDRTATIGS
jgi:hypothetical protein